ncbi:T9SS-dependent M36 family metallopeptidase [Patiriisocius hiemis]|uniref:T9SS-dependent M36 family metallopeptidase n=1 Tax=Patiriisocius hiemis TaxID=3075604 RepID=A0ABU2YAW0_9FLAO|nr:T9SS-dependent M36 family metallopeptidase [Constantimarinum sp. W242]MDT0555324.1 T9SS-dependent M36 family metallopeptidase [Constantimarinum sp. W242]
MKKFYLLLALSCITMTQAQDFSSIINNYLSNNRSQLGLQAEDVSDIVIKSNAFSNSMQLENVYVNQRHQGVEVFNAIASFGIKNGQVVYSQVDFEENLSQRISILQPSVTKENAITLAASSLGLQSPSAISIVEQVSQFETVFSNGGISLENIPVKLVYQNIDGVLVLAWDLNIYLTDRSHWYSVRINAKTGELLDIHDWVSNCSFGEQPHSGHSEYSILRSNEAPINQLELNNAGTSSYRVFPIPFENPNDTPSQLVSNPENLVASPFGWHDTNGVAGAEFTRTKGNNVDAHDDTDGNNNVVFGPDGGPTLTFDFPYGLPQQPIDYLDAATTNLFYWNNIVHDVAYQYGFDEPSGNFQQNNYGNGGFQGDFVFAQSQDGGGLNNANFGTPPDGQNGVMQMFLWNAPGTVLGTLMTVNGGPFDGQYLAFDSNYGGAQLPITPITGDLVVMEDDDSGASTDPNDGCDTITNAAALNGNIAIVRRGECNFTDKVASAEAAGAIAVVVVNNVGTDPIPMGGTGTGIGIPAIMIYQEDGDPMIAALLGGGTTINATLQDDGSGDDPFQRDGDLDNVIIAHEYGHGISNRLTGGPQAAGCLQNAEQMGEGWSDYVGLVLTMKTGDQGEDIRSVGTYALGQGLLGSGFGDRVAPYSTDFAINDATYADTNSGTVSQPHGIGSVWATMLWDLTWAFVDQYGFDSDIYNGTGGNNIAFQLVMDGMKLQNCSPGFVSGRDAILEADELTNGGVNRCLIWEAFAARGLGAGASQGSSNNRFDQVENFDVPTGPNCTLGTEDKTSFENNFIIYPNPSNGNISIKSIVNVGDVTISIFDINGRQVFTQEADLQDVTNINASGLDAGVYVVRIFGGNYSHTNKIIIR